MNDYEEKKSTYPMIGVAHASIRKHKGNTAAGCVGERLRRDETSTRDRKKPFVRSTVRSVAVFEHRAEPRDERRST